VLLTESDEVLARDNTVQGIYRPVHDAGVRSLTRFRPLGASGLVWLIERVFLV